ncbi:MAG TPA: ABC transporter permease [Fimbriiglobus sp.]|jgi:molybdate transport system permease protein
MPPGHARDRLFVLAVALLGGLYVGLIAALVFADAAYTSSSAVGRALEDPNVRFAIRLSLLSSTATAVLAIWVAVPLGYVLARFQFPGKILADALIDIPIVLPPLVVGVSLLILFRTAAGRWVEGFLPFTYAVPGVILAQFTVAAAFAARTMRVAFEQINPRAEAVALTLGCSRAGAFWRVALPEARRGVLAAATMAWARALGEFGPVLVFAGATRMKTEVLPTTVYLEMSVGNLETAIAVSLVMVAVAGAVLLVVRLAGAGAGGRA